MVSGGGGGGGGSGGSSRGGGVAVSMAELAELGGDVPDAEAGVGIEDGVDVPAGPAAGDGDQGVVTGLPPGADVLPALLEALAKGVGGVLVQAVQGVAVDVVPHLRLVYVACSRLLRVPEHLVRHLHRLLV